MVPFLVTSPTLPLLSRQPSSPQTAQALLTGLKAFLLTLGLLWGLAAPLRAEVFGPFIYKVVENTVEITGYSPAPVGAVIIPADIGGKPVTAIGPYAFNGRSGLTSVSLPQGLTTLGDGAFAGCAGLTSVSLPQGLTAIGKWAFYGCTGLTSISIPSSITVWGYSVFEWCTGLNSVSGTG